MEALRVLVCLSLICAASADAGGVPIDPRGTRPVEQGTRNEKCATERDWPFCTDDQWGPKCPSGCRILGLMNKDDHDLLKRIEKIRSLLDQNKAKHRSADQASKQTYDYLKERLTTDSGHDNNYYDLAQRLRQRITEMKIKIDRQLRILAALKDRVKDQVVEMQRLEVDIDIKLRSCKGSCKSYTEHTVDHDSYVVLDKHVSQLDAQAPQNIESVKTLYVMKSRLMQDSDPNSNFKTKVVGGVATGEQTVDVFHDVTTNELILEQEGSSSAPATISKTSGDSYLSSTSSSSSSSSAHSGASDSSRSITELGGGGGGGTGGFFAGGFEPSSTSHVTTVSCTKSFRTVVTHTKDGPVETTEEVIGGGPECQTMAGLNKGSMSSFFPGLTHTSSSSSSSFPDLAHTSSSSSFPGHTHTSSSSSSFPGHTHTSSSSSSSSSYSTSGGAKGSLVDSKTDMFGLDIAGFLTDPADDDVPDFHARSVKTVRTERQADYIGKDCVDAHQNHLKGETNGLFKIKPGGTDSTQVAEVYCQQEGLMGGWLLVQQRQSGALSFNRTWAEYRGGFGSVDAAGKGEFWLGNQNLHLLTSRGESMLKVELEDWEGGVAGAEYTVRVGTEEQGYPLHVSGYTGDAGDALVASDPGVSHNGMKFSTFDRDNDKWGASCAEMFGGGWWYNKCQVANLNGVYSKGTQQLEVGNVGVVWATYKPASLKTVRMFIRPAAF